MTKEELKNRNEIVSKNKLLESGVYFGHSKSIWNPKMKPYILTTKRGTHIIDILKTKKTLEFAYQIVKKFAEREATFIFVGTKKQAKETIKFNALRTNSFYVSERWLGGTLTNNRTIFARVRRMFDLKKLAENNFEGYTKKEGILFNKELAKLEKNLSGIQNMKSKPNIMIASNPKTDEIAIKEAKKLGIKIIGIVDTNVDPTLVDIAIPGNDDSIKSITLIITIIADAIASVKGGDILFAYQDDSKVNLPQELKSEKHFKRRFGQKTQYIRNTNFRKDDTRFRKDDTRFRKDDTKFNKDDTKFNKDDSKISEKPLKEIKPKKDFIEKESSKEFKSKTFEIKEEKQIEKNKSQKPQENLSNLNVSELREKAKLKKVKNYSKLKKDELIKVLS